MGTGVFHDKNRDRALQLLVKSIRDLLFSRGDSISSQNRKWWEDSKALFSYYGEVLSPKKARLAEVLPLG